MKINYTENSLWTSLFFRLLPYQVLLLIIDAANGIIDSICASNFIGQTAMNAIGLYSPLSHFLFALSIILVSGSQLMVGKAMGRNEMDSVNGYFSTDLILSLVLSGAVSGLLILAALTDGTRILIADETNRKAMNLYLIGQSVGIPALVLGQQLFSFLSLENRRTRTMAASFICILSNTTLDILLVYVFKMGTLGLGLASSVGLWIFCLVMLQYYISGRSHMKFSLNSFSAQNSVTIFRQGYAGAISRFMEMFRCIIVNALILRYVGNTGISAFAAVNSVMAVFWPIVFGMVAVTRMLLSITIGEEDRRSMTDIMRVVLSKGVLLVIAIMALIILLAVPFTNMFYHDPADAVYKMTVSGFRLLPLCMPLAILSLSFVCYSQATEKKLLSIVLPIVDGAVSVVVFSFLLIPSLQMNGLYIANILNGFVCAALIFGYASRYNHHFPKSMDELLMIPDDFGVSENERIDIEIRTYHDKSRNSSNLAKVDEVSERVITFCTQRGIDRQRAMSTGLALEEMASNVVEHGFTQHGLHHALLIRVVHKDNDIIMRILDNCTTFNPLDRMEDLNNSASDENIGIRIVHGIIKDIQYQNLLGLNVLTMKVPAS